MSPRLYDVVKLKRDMPQYGLKAGTVAAVVMVYDSPRRAYEIKVVDASSGKTVALLTVEDDDIVAD